jgi:DNA-binding MarR family transcriptional regulator
MGNRAEFSKVLLSVSRAVDRVQRDDVCCGDLTLQQFDTLKRIPTTEKKTLGSIAADLGIDLSTASRNLTRLEKQGYVSKVRDESDARTVILRLTKKGARALSTLSCDERDTFGAVFDRIPAAKRAAVIAGLSVLSDVLNDAESPPAAECCPPPKPEAHRPKGYSQGPGKGSHAS